MTNILFIFMNIIGLVSLFGTIGCVFALTIITNPIKRQKTIFTLTALAGLLSSTLAVQLSFAYPAPDTFLAIWIAGLLYLSIFLMVALSRINVHADTPAPSTE